VALASGAGRVLDAAQLSPDLPQSVSDCTYVFATTARQRDLTKPVFSPEQAMRTAAARIAGGERVAVLFGPERAGLENEDIARANAIISVPVNPDFPSLNLAQCVLLMAYEWRRVTAEVTPQTIEMAGAAWAENIEVEHLANHYEERLDEIGFFFPEHKSESMRLNLRNFWSRMPMTRADVQMLHGMMRQMVRWKSRGD
jgi:tRNA/rRNA methyltransferase